MSNDRVADLLRNANPVTGEPRRPIDDAWNDIIAAQREARSESTSSMRRASGVWATPRRILAVAAAILLIAGVSTVVSVRGLNGSPSLSFSITRAFGVVNADASTGGFSSTPASPSGLNLATCPTSQVCYLESQFAVDSAGNPLPTTAYKTVDGGTSWTAMSMPAAGTPDTSFSCPTALACSIGVVKSPSGSPSGPFEVGTVQSILSTTDGGATWTTHVVSINPVTGIDPSLNSTLVNVQGRWTQLQCFSSTSCIAAASVPSDQPQEPVTGVDDVGVYRAVIMRTDDGGATWTSVVLPWSKNVDGSPGWSNSQDITLSCSTASVCVGLTQVLHSVVNNGQTANVLVWRSNDGGLTWLSSWAPVPAESGGTLTCPTTQQCYAVVGGVMTSRTEQIMVTMDGGASWTFESPSTSTSPSAINRYQSISCTSASTCWIAGELLINSDGNNTQASIWSTSDSGTTWASVPLPARLGFALEVACNPVASCLAVALPPYVNGKIASKGPLSAEILSNQGG
jgi:photosystem II stability/assembly factor-like uncharacterized protein